MCDSCFALINGAGAVRGGPDNKKVTWADNQEWQDDQAEWFRKQNEKSKQTNKKSKRDEV